MFINAGPEHRGGDIEVLHGSEQLVQVNQVKARFRTRFEPLTRRNPTSKDDSRKARNVRPMNLPGDHKDADFSRLAVTTDAAQEHVETAFVGTERIEEEG
jgi:hypothetical protein